MNSPTVHPADSSANTNGSPSTTASPNPAAERKGAGRRKYSAYVWMGGAITAVLVAGGLFVLLRYSTREPFSGPTFKVAKQKLKVTIVERGSLESAENSDIIVRVKAGSKGSTNASIIKWVIDDGTQVRAGDPLVDLDDSGFQDGLKTQSNTWNKAKSDLIQAETDYQIQKIQNETDVKTAEVNLSLSQLTLSKYAGKIAAAKLSKMKTREKIQKYLVTDFEKDAQEESKKAADQFTSAYLQEISTIKGSISMNRSDKESWLDRSKWSQRMLKKGLYSPSQADADESRLASAEISLRKSEGDLDLYRQFDLEAKVTQYWSDVKVKERDLERVQKQADSKLKQKRAEEESKKAIHDQERDRYDDMKKDEKFYKMISPQDGMVVYFVPEQSRGGSGSQQSIVAQGEPVREGQKLMRIPNLAKMLVNVRVHEAMISKVQGESVSVTGYSERLRSAFAFGRQDLFAIAAYQYAFEDVREHYYKELDQKLLKRGQPAFVRVDAHPGKLYKGRVKTKATVASQADFLSSDVKVYQTMVSVDDLSLEDDLRPGMSAEVTILANETKEEVLVIPIQSVVGNIAMREKRKCFVLDERNFPQEREIVIGLSSDKMVQILDGLKEGETVVLNPRGLLPEKSDMKPGTPGTRRGADIDEGGDGKKAGKKKGDGAGKGGSGQRPNEPIIQSPNGDVSAPQDRKSGKKG